MEYVCESSAYRGYSHGLESEKTLIQGEAESQIMSPKE